MTTPIRQEYRAKAKGRRPLQPLAESKPLPRTMGEIHAIALEKQKHRWWPFNRKDR